MKVPAILASETNIAAANLYNQLGFFNTELDLLVLREQLLEPRVLELPEDFIIPTLFITANQDQVFPVELIKCAAAMVPSATAKVLVDAGHSSYFEVPDLFNQTVFEFLNGLWHAWSLPAVGWCEVFSAWCWNSGKFPAVNHPQSDYGQREACQHIE